MSILKSLITTDIRFSGIPYILRRTFQKKSTTILMFHRPSAEHLDKVLRALKPRYNIISFSQYLSSHEGNGDPLPPHSIILTFDDGWASNFSLLPVIEKHKTPITVFLMAGIMDTHRYPWFSAVEDVKLKYEIKTLSDSERIALLKRKNFDETKEYPERIVMNRAEIEALQASNLVEFGSHTMFHPILPKCTDAKAAREISMSKQKIEELTGQPCRVFSFPNGEYSERDIRICKKAGYQAAVTLDVGYNSLKADLFRLKRISLGDKGSVSDVLVRASGLWTFFKVFLGKQKLRRRHSGY